MHDHLPQPLTGLREQYASESAPTLLAERGRPGVRALPAAGQWLLLVLALLSIAAGAWKGSRQNQDFQWSGAHLVVQHVDPWAEALTKGFDGYFLQSKPNYLPLLYVLLAPLGELSAEKARLIWALSNVAFAVLSALLIARFCGLRGRLLVVVVCLFLLSTPARNSVGNGQQSLLVLMLWALAMECEASAWKGARWMQPLLLGASYFKFTFAPPVFLFVLFRRGLRQALLTLIPVFAGTIIVWLWLSGRHDAGSLLRLCREPFLVAERGYTPEATDPNLMNVMEFGLSGVGLATRTLVEGAAALLACGVLCLWAFRVHAGRAESASWQVSVLALLSFMLFKHHGYDGVVLLFPFCYAVRHRAEPMARYVLTLLAWLFYVERVLDAFHLRSGWFCVPDFCILCGVLVLVARLRGIDAAGACGPTLAGSRHPERVGERLSA